jgi:hypothetical protein
MNTKSKQKDSLKSQKIHNLHKVHIM